MVNLTLAVPRTGGEDGLWKTFDWGSALTIGMKNMGATYSGNFGFVETQMMWPITHMVAPKEEALACDSCHRKNGRLENVTGVYITGRDSNALLDMTGFALLALTLAGTVLHGVLRFIVRKRG